MKILKKSLGEEKGQALIEFALILPILLLLLVAIIDFGWIFLAKTTINNTAREIARVYAVYDYTKDDATFMDKGIEIFQNNMGFVDFETSNFQITFEGVPKEVVVHINGQIKPLIGLATMALPELVDVNSVSFMRVEYKTSMISPGVMSI